MRHETYRLSILIFWVVEQNQLLHQKHFMGPEEATEPMEADPTMKITNSPLVTWSAGRNFSSWKWVSIVTWSP